MPHNEHVYLTTLYGKTVLRVHGTTGHVELWDKIKGEWREDTNAAKLDAIKFGITKMSDEDCTALAEFINKQLVSRTKAKEEREKK